MSRNGSGTFIPVSGSWNPAVGGTTISSTDWAALLSDLASGLTTSIAVDGQTPLTASIPFVFGATIKGVADGSNASPGYYGEVLQSEVLIASAVALTSNLAADVTSVSLTAGDWDVWGSVCYDAGASTTLTRLQGWANTTSGTAPTAPGGGGIFAQVLGGVTTTFAPLCPIGTARFSLASTTIIYLSTFTTFGTSTLKAFGGIYARRRR